jgi:ADP-ribosylglycohydrolase
MIGAIAGDITGSVYEWNNIKTKAFELLSKECYFTDDSVLTVALADSILNGTPYSENLKVYSHRYPDRGTAGAFITGQRASRRRLTIAGATAQQCA